jgi:hypothetical protein
MPIPKDFANQIEDAVTLALVARGFRRRKRGLLTLPISKLVRGWVGLNRQHERRLHASRSG